MVPKLKKQDKADPVPLGDGGGKLCGVPAMMCEHGATRSGLIRPSAQGPRLEKLAISFALLASVSKVVQPSSPAGLLPPLRVDMERTFSVPPTAKTFFAVAGELMDRVLGPSSPSEKTITISWLPFAAKAEPVGWASRTRASYACASES